MLPEKIEIRHFRALRDCSLTLADSTVLVGPNGAGKSTILQALRFFFEPLSVAVEDVQHGADDDVCVTVTLGSLDDGETEAYAEYLDDGGKLVVTKSGTCDAPASYSVLGNAHPGFATLRRLDNVSATEFTTAYKAFVAENPQYGLGRPRSMADCKAELRRWERENPAQLTVSEMPFRFQGSSKTRVVPTTRVVYVPAVHRAADEFKGARSPLAQMIEALVMPDVEEKPELARLRNEWNRQYQEVFPQGGTEDLKDLSSRLSRAVDEFAPGTGVSLRWAEVVMDVPIPDVETSIVEDGVPTQIEQQGHGLQRAIIIALLQARDEQLRSEESDGTGARVSHVLLLVEEPELYQHPPRARHFRRVLNKLATKPGRNCLFRVVSTSHSPDFVSLDDVESVRIVRKHVKPGAVPERTVNYLTRETLIAEYSRLSPLTKSNLDKNLHVLDATLREAFFASAIVLTEGVSDVGILAAEAERSGHDLEARGIVMSSLGGKGQLSLAITILRMLDVRHFVVFDSDSSAQLPANQKVLRALCAPADEIPAVGAVRTAVRPSYAVLHPKIEVIAREEFGPLAFDAAVREVDALFGKGEDLLKNPAAARMVLEALFEQGLTSPTVTEIVRMIATLA